MQFLPVVAALLSTIASVVAFVGPTERDATICPAGLLGTSTYPPRCCTKDIAEELYTDCKVPSPAPTDSKNFRAICKKDAREARCCPLDLGLGAACDDPL
ncbi:hypothetical protein B0H19DRAFT_1272754 [Mycena capillaripes]|nr:hypothetical protein B0H19DRAFT_1272754 [Mycena capillaripes]